MRNVFIKDDQTRVSQRTQKKFDKQGEPDEVSRKLVKTDAGRVVDDLFFVEWVGLSKIRKSENLDLSSSSSCAMSCSILCYVPISQGVTNIASYPVMWIDR